MDKSFIRSTMECRQSSFWVVLSLKSSSTAATSTDGPGCLDGEVESGADGAAYVGPLALGEDAAGAAAAGEAGPLPKTFSIIVPKMLIARSYFLCDC